MDAQNINDNDYIIDFAPNEFAIVVDHNDDLDNGDLIEILGGVLDSIDQNDISIKHFSTANDSEFLKRSFVRIRFVISDIENPDDLILTGIEKVLDAIESIYINPREFNVRVPGLRIRAIAPNWMGAGSGPASRVDGGPGGEPSEPASQETDFELPDRKDENEDVNISLLDPNSKDCSVDVVVLDSIPSCHLAIDESTDYKVLQTDLPGTLLNLLQDANNLRIYEDDMIAQYQHLDTEKYSGQLRDHGLFVSGIIHQLAPTATPISLIQVLNDNGVGTIDSLASGVEKAIQITENSSNPLVVNMSLTFAIPQKGGRKHEMKAFIEPYGNLLEIVQKLQEWEPIQHNPLGNEEPIQKVVMHELVRALAPLRDDREALIEIFGEDLIEEVITLLQRYDIILRYNEIMDKLQNDHCSFGYEGLSLEDEMTKPIDLLLKNFKELARDRYKKVFFVGAAGNDGDSDDSERPTAMYPAAFRHVIGVGSLNKTYAESAKNSSSAIPDSANPDGYSHFSNAADEPERNGVRTLGEDIVAPYLSKYPNGNGNNTGLAKWSGTSFAAAVISGIIAMQLTNGIPNPLKVIRGLKPDPTLSHDIGVKQQ